MSTANINVSSIKHRKVPGRPGRFDPSEPFHMSTRRATKNPTGTGSPSVNGSADESYSPTGSYDDARPVTSYDHADNVSPQDEEMEDGDTVIVTSPQFSYHRAPYGEESQGTNSASKPYATVEKSPSPSRKRKRSVTSPTQPVASLDSAEAQKQIYDESLVDEEPAAAEKVDPALLSDREDSQQSSQSDEEIPADTGAVGVSIDATPQISEPASPATSDFVDDDDGAPLAKPLNAALEEVVRSTEQEQAEADAEAEADEAEDVEDADDIEEADDADENARWDDEGRPRRRFGGRRRAAHPNPVVEAHMRRQAQIKSTYRAIARAQKAILAEIADRTVDDLERNSELHKEGPEHDLVKAGLAVAYANRRTQLESRFGKNAQQLKQTYEAQRQVVKEEQRLKFADLQERQIDRLELEMLRLARAAKLDSSDAGYETEDEDDVIPKLKGMSYGWKKSQTLDDVYESRSRVPLMTQRAVDEMDRRIELQQLIADFEISEGDGQPPENKDRRFTIMDSRPRKYALARQEELDRTKLLAEAAEEVKRAAKIPVIRNEDAFALQMLGDLASRPSITHSAPPPILSKHGRENFLLNESPSRSHPPPVPQEPNPNTIHFAYSPRAGQILGDRYAGSMLPPTSSSQAHPLFRRSETPRQDTIRFSPIDQHRPLNGLPSISSRPLDARLGQQPQLQSFARHEPFRLGNIRPISNNRLEIIDTMPQSDLSTGTHPLWREYPPSESSETQDRRANPTHGLASVRLPGRTSLPEDRRDSNDHFWTSGRALKEESPPRSMPGLTAWRDKTRPTLMTDTIPRHRRMSSSDSSFPQAMDRPRSPTSGHSSLILGNRELKTESNRPAEQGQRQRRKSSKGNQPPKLSKDDRDSFPHGEWWRNKRDEKESDQSIMESPTAGAPPFAGSPREPPSSWQNPPNQRSPRFGVPPPPPPPPSSQYQGSPYASHRPTPPRHAPYQYPSGQHSYEHEHHYHRGSNFSSLPPPPPPPQGWAKSQPPPPPSPLFAVPSGPTLPPPPGVTSSDPYSRYAPPPPPSSYQSHHPGGPPHPSQQSGGAHPQPPSGGPPHSQAPPSTEAYNQQFGGLPIAPAMASSQSYHAPSGYQPLGHHLPAFAQRGHQNVNSRKRTHSDAQNAPKFHNWNPPAAKGK